MSDFWKWAEDKFTDDCLDGLYRFHPGQKITGRPITIPDLEEIWEAGRAFEREKLAPEPGHYFLEIDAYDEPPSVFIIADISKRFREAPWT